MNFDYFFSAFDIRYAYDDLPVESARSQKSRIQYVRSVSCSQDYYSGILSETIHLYQQLIQCLLPFIIAAAEACASLTSNSIDLVYEDDTWSTLLGLIEQISYTRRADADEHLNEVRSTDCEERHSRFSRSRSGNISLTCSRRSYEEHALRYSCSDLFIFPRILEEVNDLRKFLFFFFQTGYIGKGYLLAVPFI